MKLTPWFASSTKPVHVGVYKTRFIMFGPVLVITGYSHWNGECWSAQRSELAAMRNPPTEFKARQDKEWCGVIDPQQLATEVTK